MSIYPNKNGFTLMELIVVMAIIALISTFAMVAISNARKASRDAVRRADLRQIRNAIEFYYDDNNSYPTVSSYGESGTGGWDNSYQDSDSDGNYFLDFLVDGGYMASVPVDPTNDSAHTYQYFAYNGTGEVNGCLQPYYVLIGYGFESPTATEDSGCYDPGGGYKDNDNILIFVGQAK